MIHERIEEELAVGCERAFDVVHDYERRLEWDTLLREAFVVGGGPAGPGVVAVCRGRWLTGGMTIETAYASFRRGVVAAVRMTNRPPFFASWAASIRHEALGTARSRIVYTYTFRARPRALAWLIERVLGPIFRWETRRRLVALRRYLEPT